MRKSCLKMLALVAFVVALMPVLGFAQNQHGIDARQRNQQERIRQGIRSGELNRREARRLEAQQARIRIDERFARRSGGEFTGAERRRIQRELNHSSRHIYRQKHDRQDR